MCWFQRISKRFVPLALLLAYAGCSSSEQPTAEDESTSAAPQQGALAATGVTRGPVDPELARSPIYQGFLEALAKQRASAGISAGAPTSDTLVDYAAKCDAATGIHVPAFNCDLGTEVPEVSSIDTLETNAVVGTGVTGSRSVSGTVQTIVATGADTSATADQLYFSYQTKASGLATAEVKVTGLTNSNALAKAGLMIRDTTAAGAPYAWLAITPGSGLVFQTRTTADTAFASATVTGPALPIWLRLTREDGNVVSAYYSTNDRASWSQIGTDVTVSGLNSAVQIGLAVTSHAATATTATFDKYGSNKVCDNPNVLNQECDAGSRFQVLVQTADAAAVGHCRKNGRRPVGNSQYNDIAVIQYNKANGALCFYQALSQGGIILDGAHVTAPNDPANAFGWLSPTTTHGIKCTGCHDNGGFIRSHYLTQMTTPPNVLPNQGAGFGNLSSPERYVGLDFQNDRSWSITTSSVGAGDTGLPCTTCHRLGVNNLIAFNLTNGGWPNGTGANFANVATASSQAQKNPHSATSPLWMRPGTTSYFAPAYATATIFQNCALGFWGFDTTTRSTTQPEGYQAGNTTDPRTVGCTFTPLGTAYQTPLVDVNIGTTGGTRTESGTTETVTAGGAGIQGTSDQFFFAYQIASGDGTATVKVNSLVNTDPLAKAGLMFRDTTLGTSANVLVGITPTSGATFTNRLTDSGPTNAATPLAGKAAPIWLQLVRSGNTFTASVSTDNVTWTQVAPPVTFASFNSANPLLGLAVTSHNTSATTTAVFDSFTWTPATATTLADASVGTPSTGTRTESGTVESLSSMGGDIYVNADQFQFAFKTLSGDGTALTKVLTQVNTDPYAKAGLMIRDGAATDAVNTFAGMTPSGATFQDRPTIAAATTVFNQTGKVVPIWVRLTRLGSTFMGSTSPDGTTWSQITNPYTFASFNTSALVGLAVSSHTTGTTTTATFDSLTSTSPGFTWTPATANSVMDAAIGTSAGSHTSGASTETITSSGGDIYANADQFFYSFKTLSGDGTAITKVLSQVNTDPYAKAGIMIRDNADPAAVNTFVGITPSGATFQSRPTAGAPTTVFNQTGKAVPIWLRLARSGRTFVGATSPNGTTWTQVTDPVTFAAFNPAALVGLGVSSHNGNTTTAVFDPTVPGISPTGFGWTPATPTTLVDANIGITGGTHTSSGGTETITAAGADIYGASDQFFFSFKTLTGDGTIIARVTGLTAANVYSKAGLMFRDGSGASAANAMVAITPGPASTGKGAEFQYRTPSNPSTTVANFSLGKAPTIWLKIVRTGTTFTGYTAPDSGGVPGTWTSPTGFTFNLTGFGPQALVGLAVTSHAPGVNTTATFTNVTLP